MIYNYLQSKYPEEGCGVIQNGVFIPFDNVATNPLVDFQLGLDEYIDILLEEKEHSIVHNHPDNSSISYLDIMNSNSNELPYIVFGETMEMNLPEKWLLEFLGREYDFNLRNCLHLCVRFYNKLGLKIDINEKFEDDWWLQGLDYFTEDRINDYGFKRVLEDGPCAGDFLIFSIRSRDGIANHCGVYLGNNEFLHHAVNRLSCRESLGRWSKGLVGVYRHGLLTR